MILFNIFFDFFSDQHLAIPLGQIIVFTLLLSTCLITGKHQLGLLISFCFVFYWGFVFNHDYFVDLLGQNAIGFYIYIASGVLLVILTMISFFQQIEIQKPPRKILFSDKRDFEEAESGGVLADPGAIEDKHFTPDLEMIPGTKPAKPGNSSLHPFEGVLADPGEIEDEHFIPDIEIIPDPEPAKPGKSGLDPLEQEKLGDTSGG